MLDLTHILNMMDIKEAEEENLLKSRTVTHASRVKKDGTLDPGLVNAKKAEGGKPLDSEEIQT